MSTANPGSTAPSSHRSFSRHRRNSRELDHTTTYEYDAAGNRVAMVNGRGYTTSYTYDGLSRRTAVTDPLTHTISFAYGGAGNIRSRTDALDRTTVYTYDLANRLTEVAYPVGSVNYGYDKVGNRKKMVDADGTGTYTTTYGYDALHRLKEVTSPGSTTVAYEYDLVGNREKIVYPGATREVTYTYDASPTRTTIAAAVSPAAQPVNRP